MYTSLKNLGEEYEKSILIQSGVIEKYRIKLNQAYLNSNFKEIKRLNSLLKVLYEEKSELEERTHELQQYYES